MRRFMTILLLVLTLVGNFVRAEDPAPERRPLRRLAAAAQATAQVRRQWQVESATREALVFAPESARKTPSPVVFAFHGHGGTMAHAARTFNYQHHWPEAIVVYMQGLNTPGRLTDPEGKKPGWQSGVGDQGDRDLKFFDAVLETLRKEYSVDSERIYATGHSNGGGFTYLLWAARGDVFAAVAPSAAVPPRGSRSMLKPKPVLHVAGENDNLVKYQWQKLTIDLLKGLNKCQGDGQPWLEHCTKYTSPAGPPVVTFITSGDHTFPSAAPAAIVKFFQEHPGERPPSGARERVQERRSRVHVICHRGASEFAHENTLEAYRAAFELGADGNEIDIRATKDGVLVCFHDDMLDRILEAFGDVADYTWEELRQFRFREPGPWAEQCRIPTLAEVFELHRRHAGLMHLDIKRPGLDESIIALLDRFELWDHVAYCNLENGGAILKDPRLRLARYKGSLYADRGEVFPEAITEMLAKAGDGVIVDDPRGVLVALGRTLGPVSKPSRGGSSAEKTTTGDLGRKFDERRLLGVLRDSSDWNRVAESAADRVASGQRITARAAAADDLLHVPTLSDEAITLLKERVRNRSLHKEWMFHGMDGAMALRTLLERRADGAVELARFVLWRDDPALEPVVNPEFKSPRAWTDFRGKMVAFPALAHTADPAAQQVCRDYLALSDDEARRIGSPLWDEATRALLVLSPRTETAVELMKHRLSAVRGRAVLVCLSHADQAWARVAINEGAPHASAYLPRFKDRP